MDKDEKLYNYAVRQHTNKTGSDDVTDFNNILQKFYKRAKKQDISFIVIAIIGGLYFACEFLDRLPVMSDKLSWTLDIIAGAAVFVGFFGNIIIQKRNFLTGNKPYEFDLPPEIAELLRELASGELHAYMSISYGCGAPRSEWTSDGNIKDIPIAAQTFKNRFAPLLLSQDTKAYRYVWMQLSIRRGVRGPIYIVQENAATQNTQGNENTEEQNSTISENKSSALPSNREPECQNDLPQDQWLVGGTYSEFEQRLEKFLSEKIPSYRHDWFRLVLTVGRRVMRAGRQRSSQRHAADVIEKELQDTFGTKAMPGASENSRSTILKVLQGKYVDGMKAYFLPPP